ncbi:hypothetical protein ACVJGD_005907 [Bradyrhizobium sp. USDA 10063]
MCVTTEVRRVGKATTRTTVKTSTGGSVPTIASGVRMVGTALTRLCPPYAIYPITRSQYA